MLTNKAYKIETLRTEIEDSSTHSHQRSLEATGSSACGGKGSTWRTWGYAGAEFIEAVLFLARTETPWRDLPAEFGVWSTVYVYMRFHRWEASGVWRGLGEVLEPGSTPTALQLFVDSTSIPVHPHAAGAQNQAHHSFAFAPPREGSLAAPFLSSPPQSGKRLPQTLRFPSRRHPLR